MAQGTSFLDLPVEIRVNIYTYLTPRSRITFGMACTTRSKKYTHLIWRSHARHLLSVCRVLRSEVTPFLGADTIIRLNEGTISNIINRTPPAFLKFVKLVQLRLRYDSDEPDACLFFEDQHLAASALRKVEIVGISNEWTWRWATGPAGVSNWLQKSDKVRKECKDIIRLIKRMLKKRGANDFLSILGADERHAQPDATLHLQQQHSSAFNLENIEIYCFRCINFYLASTYSLARTKVYLRVDLRKAKVTHVAKVPVNTNVDAVEEWCEWREPVSP